MPASLGPGFMVEKILGIMGSYSLLHLGALFVRLSMGSLVFIAACSVRSSFLLYLILVSNVVMSHPLFLFFLFLKVIRILNRAIKKHTINSHYNLFFIFYDKD